MSTCLHHAKEHGHDRVWLGVWELNARAIAFYEKWGFEKFGEHVFMLGTDPQTDFMMRKKLE
jgi:ribosomal protein S18 acetylase RimI-like enzyme